MPPSAVGRHNGHSVRASNHRRLLPAATIAAVLLLVAVSVQSVWWTPLNVDEELTLRLAQFSFRNVFHIVSTQRGGGPVHFWLEHFLQGWWPGLEALRLPSLLFACLALPAVALIARELVGDEGGAAVVLLLAVSPIPVMYATFGRPHTLLFAWLMWGTVLALRAGSRGVASAVDPGGGGARPDRVRASDCAALRADGLRVGRRLRAALAALGDSRDVAGRARAAPRVRAVLPAHAARARRPLRRRHGEGGRAHVHRQAGVGRRDPLPGAGASGDSTSSPRSR